MLSRKTTQKMLKYYIELRISELEERVYCYIKNDTDHASKYKDMFNLCDGYAYALEDAENKDIFIIDRYFDNFYYDLSNLYNNNNDTCFNYCNDWSGYPCNFEQAFWALTHAESKDLLDFIINKKRDAIKVTDEAGINYSIELKATNKDSKIKRALLWNILFINIKK